MSSQSASTKGLICLCDEFLSKTVRDRHSPNKLLPHFLGQIFVFPFSWKDMNIYFSSMSSKWKTLPVFIHCLSDINVSSWPHTRYTVPYIVASLMYLQYKAIAISSFLYLVGLVPECDQGNADFVHYDRSHWAHRCCRKGLVHQPVTGFPST